MSKENLHVGYILEPPYSSFMVNEILGLRKEGVRVTLFNSFRPFAQQEPRAEFLRLESHYFAPRYRSVATDNLMKLIGSPHCYMKAARFIKAHQLAKRLLLLSAHYAGLVKELKIDCLHACYGTTPATIALLTSWLSEVPYSFTCHAYDIFLPNRLLALKLKEARFMTTISQFNRRYVMQHYEGVEAEKVKVVYLGVDIDEWKMPDERSARSAMPKVLCVAQMLPCKGQIYLVQACAILRERGFHFNCTIVGEGIMREALESEIKERNLSGMVTLTGALKQEEIVAHLCGADFFCLPCIVDDEGYHDGIPVALMEAMAMGLPTISTAVSGIPELIEHGRSGLLVQQRDAEAIACAMENLFKQPKLRETIGKGGRARIEQGFNLQQSALNMAELFRSAVA